MGRRRVLRQSMRLAGAGALIGATVAFAVLKLTLGT
jgi:hypothetical protein